MSQGSSSHGASRTRWAAIGAAVALSLGAGGFAVTQVTNAGSSSGERDVFVPITPCRLFDTRAASLVGTRNVPIGPAGTMTQSVTGTNGNCTLPTDASGVAMNVTIDNGTAPSYLTIWPSDKAMPLASSLNWVAGSPPTPNKVDVKLSADGKLNLFNNGGTVDVIADVVGYYIDHNHDDRYYTKAEVDAKLVVAPKVESVVISGPAFQPVEDGATFSTEDGGCRHLSGSSGPETRRLDASVELRVGVTVTSMTAMLGNAQNGFDYGGKVDLIRRSLGSIAVLATASSSGLAPGPYNITISLPAPELVTSGRNYLLRYTPDTSGSGGGIEKVVICGAEITYTVPG